MQQGVTVRGTEPGVVPSAAAADYETLARLAVPHLARPSENEVRTSMGLPPALPDRIAELMPWVYHSPNAETAP